MSIRTSPWPAGVPCWVDVSVPDVAAASEFYGEVLGWTFAAVDCGEVVASVEGAAAAGIRPGSGRAGWTLFFASDDAGATVAQVRQHGGAVLAAPADVGSLGRMAIAADPTGAVFGVWQAGTHIGAAHVNGPGGLTWDDLRSPDPDAARAFYRGVFGYRTDALPDGGPDYATFTAPGEDAPLGGMGGLVEGEGERSGARWIVYFGVRSTRATIAAAERAGGSVLVRDLDTPYGPLAGLLDPAGAEFWIIQTDGSNQPDRSG